MAWRNSDVAGLVEAGSGVSDPGYNYRRGVSGYRARLNQPAKNEQMYSQMPLATSMVKPLLPGTSKLWPAV